MRNILHSVRLEKIITHCKTFSFSCYAFKIEIKKLYFLIIVECIFYIQN